MPPKIPDLASQNSETLISLASESFQLLVYRRLDVRTRQELHRLFRQKRRLSLLKAECSLVREVPTRGGVLPATEHTTIESDQHGEVRAGIERRRPLRMRCNRRGTAGHRQRTGAIGRSASASSASPRALCLSSPTCNGRSRRATNRKHSFASRTDQQRTPEYPRCTPARTRGLDSAYPQGASRRVPIGSAMPRDPTAFRARRGSAAASPLPQAAAPLSWR